MTATVVETESVETVPRRADWTTRAGAFTVDVLIGTGVIVCLLLLGWSAQGGWLWWLSLIAAAAVFLALAVNRLLLPAANGWTLGRSLVGIRVVHTDGTPPGPWLLLLRDVAHVFDTVPLLLGWLWPLIDSKRRTFADVLVRTEVRYVDGAVPDRRRQVVIAVASAAGLATVAAGLGYLTVYRSQVTAAKTRETIAVEGPKLVADMLSYSAQSVQEDFAHDQTLVSDSYRSELTKQQESVRKTPVDNQYWVTNSAVLSASADRAAMLLLLQGQRGTAPTQRFITASVRADYVKSSGRWLIDNLTVLTPPKDPVAEATAQPSAPPASPSPPPKKPAPPAKPAPSIAGGR